MTELTKLSVEEKLEKTYERIKNLKDFFKEDTEKLSKLDELEKTLERDVTSYVQKQIGPKKNRSSVKPQKSNSEREVTITLEEIELSKFNKKLWDLNDTLNSFDDAKINKDALIERMREFGSAVDDAQNKRLYIYKKRGMEELHTANQGVIRWSEKISQGKDLYKAHVWLENQISALKLPIEGTSLKQPIAAAEPDKATESNKRKRSSIESRSSSMSLFESLRARANKRFKTDLGSDTKKPDPNLHTTLKS
jgi:hypothetical protein